MPSNEATTEVTEPKEEEAAPREEEEDWERTKTLRQLREMCTARGLASTGKKSELVARLKEEA